MKENNIDDSSFEINNTEEKINIIKENNNINNNQDKIESKETNENQPLKDSNQIKIKNTENKKENENEEEINNINANTKPDKKKSERIPLDILFKQEIQFEFNANHGCTGLVIISNTCFMSSALQCLLNCYELTK